MAEHDPPIASTPPPDEPTGAGSPGDAPDAHPMATPPPLPAQTPEQAHAATRQAPPPLPPPLPTSYAAQQMQAGAAERSLCCVSCGYNLFGLTLEQACPECGTTVRRSTLGHYLGYAPPRWLSTLMRGLSAMILCLTLAGLGIVGFYVVLLVFIARDPSAGRAFAEVMPVLSTVVSLVLAAAFGGALWLLGTRDPRDAVQEGQGEAGGQSGRGRFGVPEWLRVAMALFLIAHLIFLGLAWLDDDFAWVFLIVLGLWCIGFELFLSRCAWLANKVPSKAIAVQFRVVRIALVVTVGLAAVGIVGTGFYAANVGGRPTATMMAGSMCMGFSMLAAFAFLLYAYVLLIVFYYALRRCKREAEMMGQHAITT